MPLTTGLLGLGPGSGKSVGLRLPQAPSLRVRGLPPLLLSGQPLRSHLSMNWLPLCTYPSIPSPLWLLPNGSLCSDLSSLLPIAYWLNILL